jgi:LTXXQ motif family protein
MSSLTRAMLPAFALAAMMSIAQAQTTGQDRDAHHPGGTAAMPGQGMGSGAVVQPGTQQSGTQQHGMMGNMGQMMPMMRQMMMGQQGGMGMGMPFEHVEGRIAFLKAELKITDAQAPQWNAFAETLRSERHVPPGGASTDDDGRRTGHVAGTHRVSAEDAGDPAGQPQGHGGRRQAALCHVER